MIALLVIDMQNEYGADGALPVSRLNEVKERVSKLLTAARGSLGAAVVNVRHVSRRPGDSSFDASSPGVEFMDGFGPASGETVLTKGYPGAFSNPQLDRTLQAQGVDKVVVCGLTSFLCCDTTAREAFQLGYDVYYVDDAISEFSLDSVTGDELHAAARAVQDAMFSSVIDTKAAVELLQAPG